MNTELNQAIQTAVDLIQQVKTKINTHSPFGSLSNPDLLDWDGERYTCTIADLDLPKVDVADVLLNYSFTYPCLNLHFCKGSLFFNNHFAQLKVSHKKDLFDGNELSFSWEMAALLLSLPKQTQVIFAENIFGTYDVYLPEMDTLFSNVDTSIRKKLDEDGCKTIKTNFKPSTLKNRMVLHTQMLFPILDKEATSLVFKFKLGHTDFEICNMTKYGEQSNNQLCSLNKTTLDTNSYSLISESHHSVDGVYFLNKSMVAWVKDYFEFEGLNEEIQVKFVFSNKGQSTSKNSHKLQAVMLTYGNKQAIITAITL